MEVELREIFLARVQPRPCDRPSMAVVLIALQEIWSLWTSRSSCDEIEGLQRSHEMRSRSMPAFGCCILIL